MDKSSLSFITEWILFFPIILVLSIYFMAKSFFVFLNYTHHTFPNPPFPMTYRYSKWNRFIYFGSIIILFCYFYFYTSFDKSILKHFFVCCLDDFFDMVELLRRCYFDFIYCFYWICIAILLPRLLGICWRALVMLIFLDIKDFYLEWCTVFCMLWGW